MERLANYRDVLSPEMVAAWGVLASAVPDRSELVGGTALAMRLHHRRSYDLDIFAPEPFDAERLAIRLRAAGDFQAQRVGESALFGTFNGVKVDIAIAGDWEHLGEPTLVEGLAVASLEDIAAGKLAALLDRAALRDYFDVMAIEQQGQLRIEEAVGLFTRKWGLTLAHPDLAMLLYRLGDLSGAEDDPILEEAAGGGLHERLESFFTARHPHIVASVQQYVANPEQGMDL